MRYLFCYLIGFLAACVSKPACAEVPDWLQAFCETTEAVAPCRLVIRSHLIDGDEERLSSVRGMRSGGGVVRVSEASFDAETGERSETALAASSDGVAIRSVRGWQPDDAVETPVRAGSRFFRDVRGRIEPADPATPFVPTAVWAWGMRPTPSLSYSDLFLGRVPGALKIESRDGGRALVTVLKPSGPRRQLEGAVFVFEPSEAWPLVEFRPPKPENGVTTFSDVREVGGVWLPYRRDVVSPKYPDIVTRVESLELGECGSVEPLEFLEGMAVFDRRDEDAVHIWGRGGPKETITRAALRTYGRRPPAANADEAPGELAGRQPGRGWLFWTVNSLLVAAVAGLVWLRRRVA